METERNQNLNGSLTVFGVKTALGLTADSDKEMSYAMHEKLPCLIARCTIRPRSVQLRMITRFIYFLLLCGRIPVACFIAASFCVHFTKFSLKKFEKL